MDPKLSGEKLNEERAFIKRFTDGLASRTVEYGDDFSTALENRPKRVVPVQVAVADPPDLMDVDNAAQDASVNITVKSLRPSLSLPISVNVTDSVSQLKALISKSSSSAPPPDSQRLLLKGKALTDSKLLKEYDITDGSIVHLYLKPAAATTPASTSSATDSSTVPATTTSTAPVGEPSRSSPSPPSPAPPALTITTSVEDGPGTSIPLTNFDLAAPPPGPQPEITSATFHNTVADPTFWQKIHALCVTEFEHGDEADLAWEHFLRAMKGKLSAGEAAKIRDVVGVRGMGGGA